MFSPFSKDIESVPPEIQLEFMKLQKDSAIQYRQILLESSMSRKRLHLPGNVDDLTRQLDKFSEKYRRRPSGCVMTLCHVMWQLASWLEMGQLLTL
ncbi:hypothetical protein TNCV_697321 [Trichonephila clavipes]|nr:hypothetical protein TNCV_697321 [Trichonephila clavipes]